MANWTVFLCRRLLLLSLVASGQSLCKLILNRLCASRCLSDINRGGVEKQRPYQLARTYLPLTYTRTHACTHAPTHAHTHARTRTRTRTHTHAHTHTHTRTHTHTHTHTDIYWITPDRGSIAGGTVVKIYGSGFVTDAYSSSNLVYIGNIPCQVNW